MVEEENTEEVVQSVPEEEQTSEEDVKKETAEPAQIQKEDTKQEAKNKVEALLFSSGKFMDGEHIAEIAEMPFKEVKQALKELKQDYDKSLGSLMLVEDDGAWKINVKEKYIDLVTKIVADTELSKTVLETLAVCAWKTPILQSDVIKIRTNKAYEHISELVDAGFIIKEKYGRSYLIKLAEKFFEYFDLDGVKDIKEILKKVAEQNKQKLKAKAEQEKLEEGKDEEVNEDKEKLDGLDVYSGADSEHTRDIIAEEEKDPLPNLKEYRVKPEAQDVDIEKEPVPIKEEIEKKHEEEIEKEHEEREEFIEEINKEIDEISAEEEKEESEDSLEKDETADEKKESSEEKDSDREDEGS